MDVDPFVQNGIAGTCGNLYKPLIGKLNRYPIPNFPLAGTGALLDIGCGWGRWTIAAARSGYRATGLDPDRNAIAAAERVAAQLDAQADFVVGRSSGLPFAAGSFDIVFSYSVLQHLLPTTVEDTFGEIKRVLRPGGFALVELPNRYGLWNTVQRHRQMAAPMHYYTPQQMRLLGERVGTVTLKPEGFFALNAQPSDLDLLVSTARLVVRASTAAVTLSRSVPLLGALADSMFVIARKPRD